MQDAVKTGHETLEVRELLQSSPAILLGVSDAAAAVLKDLGIDSVFDLATSRMFENATRLLRAGVDPKDAYFRFGAPPSEVVRQQAGDFASDELRVEDIDLLEGMTAAIATRVRQSLNVATIRDLALWPPYRVARRLMKDAFFPSGLPGFDPEA